MLNIISNGSKWGGEPPDTIDKLLSVLASHPLDRRTKPFMTEPPLVANGYKKGVMRFSGNFLTISHVFQIDTDEIETINTLARAIRANMQREDYRAQPKPT